MDSSFPLILETGSSFIARPGYVESPHNFYVIPLGHLRFLPSIEIPGDHKKMPFIGNVVVFRSSKHKKYMRGEIRRIEAANTYTVYIMDHGDTEAGVKLEDIFEYISQYHPPVAIPCELFMCAPKGDTFDDDAIEAFKFYLGNDENLQIIVKGFRDEKLKVEIRNSNPDDVNTMLALTGYTCLGGASNMVARMKHKRDITWKHRQYREGQILSVRLQLAPSFDELYVCTIDDYKDYLTKRRDFIDYCRFAKDIEEQDFVVGKAVGVKEELDEPYERAVIVEVIDPGNAKVRLVDWGRESIVPISRLKLIETEMFSNDPVRAIFCSALNADAFKEFLPQSLCVGYNYRIKIEKKGSEFEKPYLVVLG